MNKDELNGKAQGTKGKLKKAVGDVTRDEELRGEGAADQVVGKTRDTVGRAKRKTGDAIENARGKLKR